MLYTKDYLLKCTASPLAACAPPALPHITKEAPEILRDPVTPFSAQQYRAQAAIAKAAAAAVLI